MGSGHGLPIGYVQEFLAKHSRLAYFGAELRPNLWKQITGKSADAVDAAAVLSCSLLS